MTFFSSPFDRPIILGQGQVGSSILATGAVYRSKIANSAIGSAQMGTFSLAKAIGTLANAKVGSLRLSYGSSGTIAGGFYRGRAGSFVGSLVSPVYRGRYGSMSGTLVAPVHRGRYGSYSGTLRGAGFRATTRYQSGSVGSFVRTLGAAVAAAASNAGSLIRGTLSSHRFNLGTEGFTGTLRGDKLFSYRGTHLVGSFTALEIRRRYARWPSAPQFSNATYIPMITLQVRTGNNPGSYAVAIMSKTTGSMQYVVANLLGNTSMPPGSIHLMGVMYPGGF